MEFTKDEVDLIWHATEQIQTIIGRAQGREEHYQARRDEFKVLDFTAELEKRKAALSEIPKGRNDLGNALTTLSEEDQMLVQLKGVSINTKPRKDGRYQGYATLNGRKRYFYGETYQEVATKIKYFMKGADEEKKKESRKESNSPTFKEFTENWLRLYKEPNLKPTTLNNMRITLLPALEAFGERRISSIKSDELQTMLLQISAPRMRELCFGCLKQIFKKAVLQQVIKRDPCDLVELKKHKTAKRHALTPREEEIFLREGSGTEYALLYRTLLATGMRIGEALALTPADIDRDGVIHVTKNVVFVRGKRIAQNTPKTEAGNRELPIPRDLAAELLSHSEEDLVFPFTYNAVSHAIHRIAKRTGMEVSAHILRHTYATRLSEAGIPAKIRQYLMGHATLDMTENVYTDIQKSYVDRLSDAVRALFTKDHS